AGAVPEGGLVPRVDDVARLAARTRHEDDARPVAGADEDVLRPRWARDEVAGPERPLLALHDEEAFAREDEEVFLVLLAVVHPAWLARLDHADRVADLGEGRLVALDDAGGAEEVVLHPRGVRDVDDEPAFGRGDEAFRPLLEPCFLDHTKLLSSGLDRLNACSSPNDRGASSAGSDRATASVPCAVLSSRSFGTGGRRAASSVRQHRPRRARPASRRGEPR